MAGWCWESRDGDHKLSKSNLTFLNPELVAALHNEARHSREDRLLDRPAAKARILQAPDLRQEEAEGKRPAQDPAHRKFPR